VLLPWSVHVGAKLEQQADYRLVTVVYRDTQRSISQPVKIRFRRTHRPRNYRGIISGVSAKQMRLTRQLHSRPRQTQEASVQQRNVILSRCKTVVGSSTHAASAANLAGATLLGDLLKRMTLMNRLLVLLRRPPAQLDTEGHHTSDMAEIQ
jgi:hypothetical protein